MAKKSPPPSNNDAPPARSGSLLGSIGASIADLLMGFDRVKKTAVEDYCPIRGVVNDYTYFLDNTGLVTVFEIKGATFIMGPSERKT